jgi:hypothetical protein
VIFMRWFLTQLLAVLAVQAGAQQAQTETVIAPSAGRITTGDGQRGRSSNIMRRPLGVMMTVKHEDEIWTLGDNPRFAPPVLLAAPVPVFPPPRVPHQWLATHASKFGQKRVTLHDSARLEALGWLGPDGFQASGAEPVSPYFRAKLVQRVGEQLLWYGGEQLVLTNQWDQDPRIGVRDSAAWPIAGYPDHLEEFLFLGTPLALSGERYGFAAWQVGFERHQSNAGSSYTVDRDIYGYLAFEAFWAQVQGETLLNPGAIQFQYGSDATKWKQLFYWQAPALTAMEVNYQRWSPSYYDGVDESGNPRKISGHWFPVAVADTHMWTMNQSYPKVLGFPDINTGRSLLTIHDPAAGQLHVWFNVLFGHTVSNSTAKNPELGQGQMYFPEGYTNAPTASELFTQLYQDSEKAALIDNYVPGSGLDGTGSVYDEFQGAINNDYLKVVADPAVAAPRRWLGHTVVEVETGAVVSSTQTELAITDDERWPLGFAYPLKVENGVAWVLNFWWVRNGVREYGEFTHGFITQTALAEATDAGVELFTFDLAAGTVLGQTEIRTQLGHSPLHRPIFVSHNAEAGEYLLQFIHDQGADLTQSINAIITPGGSAASPEVTVRLLNADGVYPNFRGDFPPPLSTQWGGAWKR